MFKLISKRGIIQNDLEHGSLCINFSIEEFEVECRLMQECGDLEKGDEVILVGYFGDDEYEDTIFHVCAYFNILKNKMSQNKKRALYLLIGLIVVILILFCGLSYYKEAIMLDINLLFFVVLLFLFVALITSFPIIVLLSYHILEKEIKKLSPR